MRLWVRYRRFRYIFAICLVLTGVFVGFQNQTVLSTPTSWSVAFQDEFSGTTLDRTKWDTMYRWKARTISKNRELQCYQDNRVSVNSGYLHLVAARENAVCPANATTTVNTSYASGMISSKFQHTYGYYEFRARVPKGRGFWPALWLNGATGWPPEIDVAEVLGHEPARVHMNVHWGTASAPQSAPSSVLQHWSPDFSQMFHTFGVDWQPGLLIWYVDGLEFKRFTGSNVPSTAHYLIANLAVGGDWPGAPDASTVFPSTMQVDYIRVLRRVSNGSVVNVISNPGFESELAGWQTHGIAQLNSLSKSGRYAVRLEQEAGVRRTITGLKPYTRYVLSAHLRSMNGGKIMVGVKDYGGAHQLVAATSSSSYAVQSLTFTTGNTSSAFVFAYQGPGVIGMVDDFVLTVAP